jgi:cyanophycinase
VPPDTTGVDSPPMHGTIALVGSGEFTPSMAAVDRALLLATGCDRPRVVVLPTASWPDGEETFQRWAAQGEAHFAALGAEVEPVLVRGPEDANDPAAAAAIGEADLVYLSGGKPGHLLDTLSAGGVGAALRAAHARGAVVAGCSAGAMVLAGRQLRTAGCAFVRFPVGWRDALGMVPGTVVIPHYDAFPEPLSAVLALAAPMGTLVLGIDEETALVGRDGTWQVHGRGRVTVWRGRHRERLREDDLLRLNCATARAQGGTGA